MSKTGIQWTDRTFNPVTGCTKVSAGCKNCYASTLHGQRYNKNVEVARMYSGFLEEGERHIRADENWQAWGERVGEPAEGWAVRARALGVKLPMPECYDTPFEIVMTHEDRLREPLSWRKPQRVFVGSMTDLFHEDVPDSILDQVFAVMALTPHITYQLLTKRPERMAEYLTRGPRTRYFNGLLAEWREIEEMPRDEAIEAEAERLCGEMGWCAPTPLPRWPLTNVWLGTSVEDQDAADRRIPELLRCPAAVRFLSCEPLLGAIVLPIDYREGACDCETCSRSSRPCTAAQPRLEGIDWGIIGSESGPKARATNIAWIGDLRRQFQAAGVPVFVKQYGSNPYEVTPVDPRGEGADMVPIRLRHPHGGNPEEWAEEDRVREFPLQ